MQIPTLWDLIGNVIGLVYVFGSVFLLRTLKNRIPRTSLRKILHFAMGFWIFIWLLFETRIGAIITPIIATIALATASRKVKDSFSEKKERHIGLVIFASSITWITLFFWQEQTSPRLWIGAGAFLSLAWVTEWVDISVRNLEPTHTSFHRQNGKVLKGA